MSQIQKTCGDSHKFWRVINNKFFSKSGSNITQVYSENRSIVLEGTAAADELNRFFCNISSNLSAKFTHSKTYDKIMYPSMRSSKVPYVSLRKVIEQLNMIDENKSSGFRDLPAKLLKKALLAVPEIYTAILNLSLGTEVFHSHGRLPLLYAFRNPVTAETLTM